MRNLPISIILLSGVIGLIFLGAAQRVLDRMRLTDTEAILLLVLFIVAHFLPVITLTQYLALNLGALIPFAIIIYLCSPQKSMSGFGQS